MTLSGFATPCYVLSRSVVPDFLRPHGLQPTRLLSGHALLQRIFPNPRCNPGLPHLQADSLPTEPTLEKSLTLTLDLSFYLLYHRGLELMAF